jgi:retron-type reverse transcriptase
MPNEPPQPSLRREIPKGNGKTRLSCHQALSVLGQIIATRRANWISDADIKGFFDHVSHPQLVELLRQRIQDPRLL